MISASRRYASVVVADASLRVFIPEVQVPIAPTVELPERVPHDLPCTAQAPSPCNEYFIGIAHSPSESLPVRTSSVRCRRHDWLCANDRIGVHRRCLDHRCYWQQYPPMDSL